MPLSPALFLAPIARQNASSDVSASEKIMRMSARERRGIAGFDPQGCVAFLRARHPAKTARCVEAASRVPARTVERWLADDAVPSIGAFARLVAAYGPAFVAAAIPGLAWVERAAAFADHDGMSREIEALEARRAHVAARLGFGDGGGA